MILQSRKAKDTFPLSGGGKEIAPDDEFTAASVKGAVKNLPMVKSYDELAFRDMFISYLDSIGGEISGAPDSLKIVE